MARILILRAASAAAQTLESLRADGHEPLSLPVGEIVPLQPSLPDLPGIGAVIVTSVNAIAFAARHLPRNMAMVAVGAVTGAALRAAGFENVAVGEGSADAGLLRLCGKAERVLYLAGRLRTDGLERAAVSTGRQICVLEVYDTRPLTPSRETIAAMLGNRPPDAILVLSRGQAEGVSRLRVAAPDLVPPTTLILCISERVAAALDPAFHAAVHVAPLGELKHRLARL